MLDKSLGEKIKNYFSGRIEEIKDGTYIPQYERFVSLPEFSSINRRTFKITRNEWYLQHFSMPFVRFTARLEKNKKTMDKEIDIKRIKGKRNTGIGLFIIGWIIVVFGILGFSFWWGKGMGSIISVIICIPIIILGFILVLIGLIRIIRYRSDKKSND